MFYSDNMSCYVSQLPMYPPGHPLIYPIYLVPQTPVQLERGFYQDSSVQQGKVEMVVEEMSKKGHRKSQPRTKILKVLFSAFGLGSLSLALHPFF